MIGCAARRARGSCGVECVCLKENSSGRRAQEGFGGWRDRGWIEKRAAGRERRNSTGVIDR